MICTETGSLRESLAGSVGVFGRADEGLVVGGSDFVEVRIIGKHGRQEEVVGEVGGLCDVGVGGT